MVCMRYPMVSAPSACMTMLWLYSEVSARTMYSTSAQPAVS